jgi:flagellar FliJ protein
MTLSIDGHRGGVPSKITYRPVSLSAKPTASATKTGRPEDPRTRQKEAQVADLKRRIPILKRLTADCDFIAADLDQEIHREEERVRIHDRAHFAYSIYARATTLRRDNLRRSADELRAHLAEAEKALRQLGEFKR